MGASKRLRTTGRGNPIAGVTGVLSRVRAGQDAFAGPNYGTSDVRGLLQTRVITLGSFGGTDAFKIRVEWRSAERIDELVAGKEGTVETVAFVRGTNATAAAIQTALRTATAEDVTVAGTTDEGPFTVTQEDTASSQRSAWELSLVDLVGCSGHVTSGAVTYLDATGHILAGQAGDGTLYPAANTTASSPGRGAGLDVPLGYSIVTDGDGQTAQATLLPVVIDSAVGGNDQVVISGTEDASGGTSAIVGYSIFKTLDDAPHSTVYTEDADADVTVTGLDDATDYYVIGFTQTVNTDGDANTERVSRPSPREYFTTT
jgi:hypothetical protein